jgi:putative phosphoribosyl transferase
MWQHRFHDREQAGQLLAQALAKYTRVPNGIVLALPRGGVPVAREIAETLELPLDILVVRKLGTPGQPELAMGAIASGGARYINQEVVQLAGVDEQTINRVTADEQRELARRERAFRGDQPPLAVANRTVIVVDDGMATGSTMMAGVRALRALRPKQIVVAVPVGSREALSRLREVADECVCLKTPPDLLAIGQWYSEFPQLTDAEVTALLAGRTAPAHSG